MKTFLLGALFFPVIAYATCTVSDDKHNRITLHNPATRIIALAPDITETLFAIGAGKKVIGVVKGCDYPQAARSIPQVGSYNGIDLERIVSLHPDLIVVWSQSFTRQLVALKKWNIPIYIAEPHQLEDIPRTMKNLGCLTGETSRANEQAQQFLERLQNLKQQYSSQKIMTVFYQLGDYSLITINRESWINQVITLCGGRNPFADSKWIAPEITWEAAVSANPQVIINSNHHDEWKKRWQAWPAVAAVKKNFLFTIHPDLMDRAGPRLMEGASQLCADLQLARQS